MLLIELQDVQKSFGDRLICQIDSLKIYEDSRIGLVGPNGAGKTTILNMLAGELAPDQGVVKRQGTVGYLRQGHFLPDDAPYTLSGGEAMRLRLEDVLRQKVHLLIVDEPTANLDIDAIRMVEEKLLSHKGALIIVAHDHVLLDRICTQIIALEDGQLRLYQGNYSAYLSRRELDKERKYHEHELFQREKKRLEEAITTAANKSTKMRKTPARMGNSEARLHKRAVGAKKAKVDGRAKALASRLSRLEVKEKPQELPQTKIDIRQPEELHNRIVIRASNLSMHFPGKTLFKEVDFQIPFGRKVALVGPNGSGKTTLLEMVYNRQGGLTIPDNVKFGYFSQDLRGLALEKTVLQNVLESTSHRETFVRQILARLLFKEEEVHKKVAVLSGGERVKCAFAKIFVQEINTLLMDEPGNYLDIPSLTALAGLISDYEGTVLFVSHDREFISSVADSLLVFANEKITWYPGTFDQYTAKKRENPQESDEQLMILQNRLARLVGEISVSPPSSDKEELEREYKELVSAIRDLKNKR